MKSIDQNSPPAFPTCNLPLHPIRDLYQICQIQALALEQPFTEPDGQRILVALQGGRKGFGRGPRWDGGLSAQSGPP